MAKSTYLVFDVESVVDAALLNEVRYRGQGLTPAKAKALAEREAVEKFGNDFLPYTFHEPVAVAMMVVDASFRCVNCMVLPEQLDMDAASRGVAPYDTESERLNLIVKQFWELVEYTQPRLVSFNGRQFDMPLLELMAFKYGLTIKCHLTEKYGARYRFGDAHIDLQEFMTNYGASRLAGGLNLLSRLLGRAGKGEITGDKVAKMYEASELDAINAYCLHDVLDTYGVFLRSRVMLGLLEQRRESALLEEAGTRVNSHAPLPVP